MHKTDSRGELFLSRRRQTLCRIRDISLRKGVSYAYSNVHFPIGTAGARDGLPYVLTNKQGSGISAARYFKFLSRNLEQCCGCAAIYTILSLALLDSSFSQRSLFNFYLYRHGL